MLNKGELHINTIEILLAVTIYILLTLLVYRLGYQQGRRKEFNDFKEYLLKAKVEYMEQKGRENKSE